MDTKTTTTSERLESSLPSLLLCAPPLVEHLSSFDTHTHTHTHTHTERERERERSSIHDDDNGMHLVFSSFFR